MQRIITTALAFAAVVAIPLPVLAHSGTGGALHHGIAAGALHPLLGLDHLLAMLAVGVWAIQLGGKARWVVPLAFISCMSLGALLPATGLGVPMIEGMILASILVLGLLLSVAWRLPVAGGAVLVGAFALCHGAAHVTEMPGSVSAAMYVVGFTGATAALHLVGMTLGLLPAHWHRPVTRACGAACMAAAVVLIGGALY